MDCRVGKILDAAGMIEIEMRDNDLAHVIRAESEPLDLPDRRVRLDELRSVEADEDRVSRGTGSRISLSPNPVSTSTSPSRSVSISRQWQTSSAGPGPRSGPSMMRPPHGHIMPQLR